MKLVTHYPEVAQHVELAFRRAVDEVVGEARLNVGVSVSRGLKLNAGDVQGGMRASVTSQMTGRLSARVGSPHRGAMMREKGGMILPVRRKLLSWVDPITGKRVFAKRVHQLPGFLRSRTGRGPWLQPAGETFPKSMDDHLKALGSMVAFLPDLDAPTWAFLAVGFALVAFALWMSRDGWH